MSAGHEPSIVLPGEIPILPLADGVAFPFALIPLTATETAQVRLIDEAVAHDRIIGLVGRKGQSADLGDPADLYSVGTAAGIAKLYRFPGDVVRISAKGLARFRITKITGLQPYMRGAIEQLDTVWPESDLELEAWRKNIETQLRQIIELSPGIPDEVQLLNFIYDAERLGYLAASGIEAGTSDKQAILEEDSIVARLSILSRVMAREVRILKLRNEIQGQVRTEIEKDQKEYYLKEQMKAIQKELGVGEGENPEAAELRARLEQKRLPPEPRKAAEEELERLSKMPQGMAEVAVSRTYIEWILQLPWLDGTEDRLDLERGQRILDHDHYDLEDVKERIIEYLAVKILNRDTKTPILCFVGPPGVGKTSMGRSIARALDRRFVRLSLGGMHDEAEIRGHRRTYVGAMPGRIIQGIREAGSNNPVFMLDEVDKIGKDFRGDPTSALLEVLDPEQNSTFRDNYLNVPFDLSRVKFITTANQLDTIPDPLRDRMEIIRIPGYTEEEKIEIARKYLVPKQVTNAGLSGASLRFVESGLREIISRYTREAGVRELERQIGKICRKTARRIAGGKTARRIAGGRTARRIAGGRTARRIAGGKSGLAVVSSKRVADYLGARKYTREAATGEPRTGVATGLAWTPSGGEILFVETSAFPGSGKLVLTGQLGDIMRESAMAALTWVRSSSGGQGFVRDVDFQKTDLHVHVPAGATPKDGPSAGAAMAVSMLSALSGRPARQDVAVTGEVTLQGRVLPVGGIKEKVLGARASGIRRVVLPAGNEKDIEEIPDTFRKEMSFHLVESMDQLVPLFFDTREGKR
ncbi:endopeptidase La [Candidatus Fermentibacterales bacterium]|nr:endopeptidase La [Candidatus Fermentibacterales bacterium]